MINERSVEFIDKVFEKITTMNNDGVDMLPFGKLDLKTDVAMLMIITVPKDSNDDNLIMIIKHCNHLIVKLSEFMSSIDAFSLNAQWAYSFAHSIKSVTHVRLKECYSQLRFNRNGGYAFGNNIGVNDVYRENVTGSSVRRD
tara:strand:+ start:1128 stop:1553 length:426 start_codon:yes stop_codon:yes gene_type:complete